MEILKTLTILKRRLQRCFLHMVMAAQCKYVQILKYLDKKWLVVLFCLL